MQYLLSIIFISLSLGQVKAAEIIKYKGELLVNNRLQKKSMKLNAGDIVESRGKNSFFIVKYEDGSSFIVKEGKIEVKKLDRKKKISNYSLIRGIMGSFVKPNMNHQFTVKRNAIVFGVRGTKFWLSTEKEDTYLCVCSGKVSVEKNKKIITLKKHEDIKVSPASDKLEKSYANSQMWDMAKQIFGQLGIEI